MEPTNAEIMAKLDLILSALGEGVKPEKKSPVLKMTEEEYSEHLKENERRWEALKKKRRKERSAAIAASKPKTRRKLPRRKTA
jgi:RecA-family ATPase